MRLKLTQNQSVIFQILLICFCSFITEIVGNKNPDPAAPLFSPNQFNIYNIKTPQLIGIIFGCVVFITTISVVIYLLYASGTLSRAFEEIKNSTPTVAAKATVPDKAITPYHSQPELYEHLLKARFDIPKKLVIPTIDDPKITLKALTDAEIPILFQALNGSPQYDESEYDVMRIWGWSEMPFVKTSTGDIRVIEAWQSEAEFREYIQYQQEEDGIVFVVIIENEYRKPIGMIALGSNSPVNLSIRIGKVLVLCCQFYAYLVSP